MAVTTGDFPVPAADVLTGAADNDTISGLTLDDTLAVFGRNLASFASADVAI